MGILSFRKKKAESFNPAEVIASKLPSEEEFRVLEIKHQAYEQATAAITDFDLGRNDSLIGNADGGGLEKVLSSPQRAPVERSVRGRSWWQTAAVAASLAGVLVSGALGIKKVYAEDTPKAPASYRKAAMSTAYKGLEGSGLIQTTGISSIFGRRLTRGDVDRFLDQEFSQCPDIGRKKSKKGEKALTPQEIEKSSIDLSRGVIWVFEKNKTYLDATTDMTNNGQSFEVPINGSVLMSGPLCTTGTHLPLEVVIKGEVGIKGVNMYSGVLQCDKEDFVTDFYISASELKRAMGCGLKVGEPARFVLRAPITTYKMEGKKRVPETHYIETSYEAGIPFVLISPDQVVQARRNAEFREMIKSDRAPSVPGTGLSYAPKKTPNPLPSSGITPTGVAPSKSLAEHGIPLELQKGCCPSPVGRESNQASSGYQMPSDSEAPQKKSKQAPYDVDENPKEGKSRWSGAVGPALGIGEATFQPLGGIDPVLSGKMLGIYADVAYASPKTMAEARILYLASNVTDETTGTHLNATFKTIDLDGFGVTKLGPVSVGARGAIASESFDNSSTAGFSRGVSSLEGLVGLQMGDKLFLGGMAGFGKVKDNTQPSIPDSNGVFTYGGMAHVDLGSCIVGTGSYEKLSGAVKGTDVDIQGSHLKLDVRVNILQVTHGLGLGVAGGLSKTSLDFSSVYVPTAPFESNKKYGALVLTW
ncbi:MAG: hypothetical protein AABX70_01745 [Nanoarchaeota archaeon]